LGATTAGALLLIGGNMKFRTFSVCGSVLVLAVLALNANASTIYLESASNFAVLGGAGITAGGPVDTISGNIGDYPLDVASITGFPSPGSVVNGSIYGADNNPGGIANQAQLDENSAYDALAALTPNANDSGVTLGSGGSISTLTPGVYYFSSSAQVDGTLTLNFNSESNAIFVFQIGSTLTTGSSASIAVENGNSTDAIYWVVGSSATLGSSTAFVGNILASASITLGTSSSILCGRALADTGSVTLDGSNSISDNCSVDNFGTGATDYGSAGFSGGTTPEPGTFLLVGIGLAVVVVKRSARKG
jgi:hypothetical protein